MHTQKQDWQYSLTPRDLTWPGLYQLNTQILAYGIDGEEGIYLDNPDDAKLMFAAPAMLEALQMVNSCFAPDDNDATVEVVRNAIKLATP